jgi:hypothetical protein
MRKVLLANSPVAVAQRDFLLHPLRQSMRSAEDMPFRYQALPEVSDPTADIAGHFGEPDHSKTVI